MAKVYLGLGSNLGDRAQNLYSALRQLEPNLRLVRTSTLYETEPWGIREQPQFLNMAAEVETSMQPQDLLAFLKGIEEQMGRTRGTRYGPRLIDLDILLYDDRVMKADDLELPHPRMADRRFVLVPLAEIAPRLVHPVLGVPIASLLARLADDGSVQPYSPPVQ